MECSVCGVSREKARLLDAISSKGIVKLCESCFKKEDMPILRRPTTFQLKEAEKKPIIYKRPLLEEVEKTETTLKDVIDKNYEATVSKEKKPMPDLVDNFHWIIMRTRRLKKLTQEQLAKEISESIAAIKMIEDGILPEDDYRLVNKIGSFLGINLIKGGLKIPEVSPEKPPARIIKFDTQTMKDLTISDLKTMKEQTEEISESLEENQETDLEENQEKDLEENQETDLEEWKVEEE